MANLLKSYVLSAWGWLRREGLNSRISPRPIVLWAIPWFITIYIAWGFLWVGETMFVVTLLALCFYFYPEAQELFDRYKNRNSSDPETLVQHIRRTSD